MAKLLKDLRAFKIAPFQTQNSFHQGLLAVLKTDDLCLIVRLQIIFSASISCFLLSKSWNTSCYDYSL